METGPQFKVSSNRPEKRRVDLAIPGLVVQRDFHYTIAVPIEKLIRSVAYKNDNSACLHVLIMAPDPYFT